MFLELYDYPVDEIDPHEWFEQEVVIQWGKTRVIEQLSMNRVNKFN